MLRLTFLLLLFNNVSSILSESMPGEFVNLKEEIPDLILEIRYATKNNFMGEILDGYESETSLGLKDMAIALKKVQDKLKIAT